MSIAERKAGAASVDPDDFNVLIDAVVTLQSGGGGGSQPVSVTLYQDADVTLTGTAEVSWDTIYDNIYDRNELEDLPAGIGLTLDGSALTTTVTGVWSFSLLGVLVGNDATWSGQVTLDNLQLGIVGLPVQAAGVTRKPLLSETLALPSGVQLATVFQTIDEATGDLKVSGFFLEIVRLA